MAEFTYPLDGTQNYTAAQAGAFHGTRTSGVWSGDNNLKVTITGAHTLTLSAGIAWFTTDTYWGKVYVNTAAKNFTAPTADGALDRILRLVVRWNKTNNTTTAMLRNGSLSSNPTAPARSTTDEVYDLVIADYRLVHGETELTAANLTDQRLNESLCGLMRDGVTRLPTETLYNQFTALLAELEYDLDQVIAGAVPAHAATHRTGGVDAMTPKDIGAAPAYSPYEPLTVNYSCIGEGTDTISTNYKPAGKVYYSDSTSGNSVNTVVFLPSMEQNGEVEFMQYSKVIRFYQAAGNQTGLPIFYCDGTARGKQITGAEGDPAYVATNGRYAIVTAKRMGGRVYLSGGLSI